jgi:hypothetical protein
MKKGKNVQFKLLKGTFFGPIFNKRMLRRTKTLKVMIII